MSTALPLPEGTVTVLLLTTCDLVTHDRPEGVALNHLGEHLLKDTIHAEPIFQRVLSELPAQFPPLRMLAHRLYNGIPS